MKWFTYLLRHGVVIAIVIGIAITYVYRQQLFPKFFEQGAEDISVAQQADQAQTTDSAKDAKTAKASAGSGLQDESTGGQAEPPSSVPGADRQRAVAPSTEQAAQKDVADIADAGQQQLIKTTPSEAGVAIDKSASNVAMTDKAGPAASQKTEQAVQDKAKTVQGPEQADTAPADKGSIDPTQMASEMMKDPVKSMSGMMQKPAQTMSGMINPAAPGSAATAQDPATAQTQTATPGAAPGQTHPGWPGAYRQPQRPAPAESMQQAQPTAPGTAPAQGRTYPGWPGADRQPQRPAPAESMQQAQPTTPEAAPTQRRTYPGWPGAYGQQRPVPAESMQQAQPTTPEAAPTQRRTYPGWPGAYGQQRPVPAESMQQAQPTAPEAAPTQRRTYPGWPGAYGQPQRPAPAESMQQAQPTAPEAAPSQRQAYPGWPGAYRQQRPAPSATAPVQGPEATAQQQYQQIINKARHAYWQGQYQQSVTFYEQAIKLMPETPDGYGELGNVHYAQGEWDKAGESLYQAAIRLLDKGRTDKANNLLSIIRGLQHERAAELEKRLQTQQSGQ